MEVILQDSTYLIDKCRNIVDSICNYAGYNSNIRHLLYVIVPAFVEKYGLKYEKLIVDCFKTTLIYIGKDNDSNVEAFFYRKLFYYKDEYFTKKYIVINGFNKSEYIYLIDTVVHEFNHSLNSMENEIKKNDKEVLLRTGLSFSLYNREIIDKSKSFILEEMINTKQSEEIVSTIYNFNYNGNNIEIKNMIETIKKEKNQSNFKSNAYRFFMECCRDLLDNKTFIKNVELYRLNGNINEIEIFFDDICGKKGSYNELCELLYDLYTLINKYEKSTFRFILKSKIKERISRIRNIVGDFCSSSVYK